MYKLFCKRIKHHQSYSRYQIQCVRNVFGITFKASLFFFPRNNLSSHRKLWRIFLLWWRNVFHRSRYAFNTTFTMCKTVYCERWTRSCCQGNIYRRRRRKLLIVICYKRKTFFCRIPLTIDVICFKLVIVYNVVYTN